MSENGSVQRPDVRLWSWGRNGAPHNMWMHEILTLRLKVLRDRVIEPGNCPSLDLAYCTGRFLWTSPFGKSSKLTRKFKKSLQGLHILYTTKFFNKNLERFNHQRNLQYVVVWSFEAWSSILTRRIRMQDVPTTTVGWVTSQLHQCHPLYQNC